MKIKGKKLGITIAAAALAGTFLFGCGTAGGTSETTTAQATTAATTTAAATTAATTTATTTAAETTTAKSDGGIGVETKSDGTKVVTDVMGRQVEFKDEVNSIIAIPWPWSSFIFAITGSTDKIATMSSTALASYKNCMFQVLAPGLADSDTGFIEDKNKDGGSFGTMNVEEMMKINPDMVIIYKRDAETMLPILESAGIKTVVFDYGDLQEVQDGMKILGGLLGGDSEKNAETMIKWHEDSAKEMDSLFGSLSDDEKPTVLHLYDENLKVVTNSFNTNMIERAGGKNVATEDGSDQTNSANDSVNFEQILAWDPDYIVLGNFSKITPEQIYNNELAGQDWSQLTAVKNKRVYKVPMGLYRWDAPNTEAHLFMEWFAKMLHPDKASSIDLEADTKEYYKTLFNHDVTDDEMKMIYHADLNANSEEIKLN